MRHLRQLVLAPATAAILLLAGCGSSTSSTAPTRLFPVGSTTVMFQNTFTNIPAGGQQAYGYAYPQSNGTLTATLGWTYPDDGFTPYWLECAATASGGCTNLPLTTVSSGSTSGSWSTEVQGFSTYVFVAVANSTNPHPEAASLQITLKAE